MCGYIICKSVHSTATYNPVSLLGLGSKDETTSCEDTSEITDAKFISSHQISSVHPALLCNGICDIMNCVDESVCNGYRYGAYCQMTANKSLIAHNYIQPLEVCDGRIQCMSTIKMCEHHKNVSTIKMGHSDETICECDNNVSYKEEELCERSVTGSITPIFNFTRCT